MLYAYFRLELRPSGGEGTGAIVHQGLDGVYKDSREHLGIEAVSGEATAFKEGEKVSAAGEGGASGAFDYGELKQFFKKVNYRLIERNFFMNGVYSVIPFI